MARQRQDEDRRRAIRRVWDEHQQVYGPKKVWKQPRREGYAIARCTVVRLMRVVELHGVVRARAWTTTTQAGDNPRPADLVARRFTAL